MALHRTAETWGRPPTAWLGGNGEWTEQDNIFTHAVTLYKAGLCPECGQPFEVCETGAYYPETRVCQSTATTEQWRKENPTPPPGTIVEPVKETVTVQDDPDQGVPDWVLAKTK